MQCYLPGVLSSHKDYDSRIYGDYIRTFITDSVVVVVAVEVEFNKTFILTRFSVCFSLIWLKCYKMSYV